MYPVDQPPKCDHLLITIIENETRNDMEPWPQLTNDETTNEEADGFERSNEESDQPVDFSCYNRLCWAIEQREWEDVEDFVHENPEALSATISRRSETIFQKIIFADGPISLVRKFVSQVDVSILQRKDCEGNTALFDACINGKTKAAQVFVERDRELLYTEDIGLLPLHKAARYGHKETVDYLLSVTDINRYTTLLQVYDRLLLIVFLMESNIYGIALDLLKLWPEIVRESNRYRLGIFHILANKPQWFESGSQFGYFQRFIYRRIPVKEESSPFCHIPSRKFTRLGFLCQIFTTLDVFSLKLQTVFWNALRFVPSIKHIHDAKEMHMKTLEMVRIMCVGGGPWTSENAPNILKEPLLTAAKLGISEIVIEIIKTYFPSHDFMDEDGCRIFDLAVSYRQEKVFNLIYQIRGLKEWVKARSYMTITKNEDCLGNILHLAGSLVPSSEVSGGALQMQREIQWFKAVENVVIPYAHEQQNSSKRTPKEEFTKQHEDLIKEGESWMKENARSCAIVTTLLVTIAFAAAFAVPGGSNTQGSANFLHKPYFIIFVVSDVFTLIFSIASLLMSLVILTSRFAEKDFLESLLKKLFFGIITLFFSVLSMMVVFGTAIYILLFPLWKWLHIPIAILCCFPVILFARLQFPLLIEIYVSTYTPSIYKPVK